MRRGATALALLVPLSLAVVAGCSSGSGTRTANPAGPGSASTPRVEQPSTSPDPSSDPTPTPTPTPSRAPTLPPPRGAPGSWTTAVQYRGRPEIQTQTLTAGGSTVVVLRADAATTKLVQHPGYEDPGAAGWPTADQITDAEKPNLLAMFNGGFRLNLGLGGFQIGSRVGAPMQPGFASVVTYGDGSADIGLWGTQVPNSKKQTVSVRQNLGMLVDNGALPANIDQYGPWGATLGGGFAVARSGLGIDAFGNLLYASSSYATPRAIGQALIDSGAIRAMQLDINPQWVCSFTVPDPYTVKVGLGTQSCGVGTFLNPYGRDWFSIARTKPVGQ